jgi:membrane-associated protein
LDSAIEFLRSLYNPERLIELIRSGGYVVLAAIVFAETGLFIGFFLPGDSLLFTAGLVASQGFFNVIYLMVLLSVMAIIGDAVGYSIGYKAGTALYKRDDSFWFRRKHLLYAKEFYEKHGGKAIFLARFVPFARTFAPVVAGIAQMSYPRFAGYNIFGVLSGIDIVDSPEFGEGGLVDCFSLSDADRGRVLSKSQIGSTKLG